ncbi:RecB family exonuclease [Mycobacterium avium subsp. hominissuis]
MGVELGAGGEHHRVVPTLGVGELHTLAHDERAGNGHAVQRASRLAATGAWGLSAPGPRLPNMIVQPEARQSAARPAGQVSRPALSPSRAADFKQCPLLYRFRAIDRLPEAPSPAQLRGSLVHAALQQLYELPAAQRGPETALALVGPAWEQLLAATPELTADLDPTQHGQLLAEAQALLAGYYRLEDPTRFDPQCCEERVEVELADGTLLRGFIDRIDVAATGELRVVDYKTGKAPPAARALAEFKAMFQMKFYAVALLRSRGVPPTRLRLIYLADGQVLDYSPEYDELLRFEKTLMAIWRAIQSAGRTGDFRPTQSRLCDWCPHQQLCPLFGGTPPPYPGWPDTLGAQDNSTLSDPVDLAG